MYSTPAKSTTILRSPAATSASRCCSSRSDVVLSMRPTGATTTTPRSRASVISMSVLGPTSRVRPRRAASATSASSDCARLAARTPTHRATPPPGRCRARRAASTRAATRCRAAAPAAGRTPARYRRPPPTPRGRRARTSARSCRPRACTRAGRCSRGSRRARPESASGRPGHARDPGRTRRRPPPRGRPRRRSRHGDGLVSGHRPRARIIHFPGDWW